MLVIGYVEQPNASAAPTDHAKRIEADADQFGLICHQHQLVALYGRETGYNRTIAADIVDVGDALATASSAAILIG